MNQYEIGCSVFLSVIMLYTILKGFIRHKKNKSRLIENILFSVILVFLVLKKHIYGLMDAAFFYRFCKVSIVFFFILMGVREKQEICERKDKQICSCCTQLKIYWITLFLLFDVHFGIVTEELLWFLEYVSIVFCIFICYNWHKYGRNRKNEDTKSEKIHTQK